MLRIAALFSLALIGASTAIATPAIDGDAICARVIGLLRTHYRDAPQRERALRVLALDRRLGAYRAATTPAALAYRLNADLRVATHDARVRVWRDGEGAHGAGGRSFDLAEGLRLTLPER